MIVGIHQPNYLPYLGFFDKIKKSDIFIIYDDAQFNKEDFQHRNRIRIFNGWKWLTVPVDKKYIPINKVKIKDNVEITGISWQDSHFRNLHDNYKEAEHYIDYENNLREIYEQKYKLLFDINMELIKFFIKAFNINTKIIFSSEFGFNTKSSSKLVDLVSAVGGDTYISGPMGKNYLELELFNEKNIKVEFQEFKHPVYKQQYDGFYPNMSAVDALFNIGPKIDLYE